MSALVAAIVAAIVSAVLGGIGTYLAARRDLQLRFDASLRDLRIEAYKPLWKELELLAKYGRPDSLAKSEAQQLRDILRTWYFHTGGLVLSTQTRHDYFALLDGLEVIIARSDNLLREGDDEFLRVLGSRLRTAMTRDAGTRRTFVFRGDADPDAPKIEERTYVESEGVGVLTLSAKRRLGFKRRLKVVAKLQSNESTTELSYAGGPAAWDSARRAIIVTGSSPGEQPDERVLLVEHGRMVEGPRGWHRGDTRPRAPGKIWKQISDGAASSRAGHGT